MSGVPITIVMTTWAPEGDTGALRLISAKAALDSWLKYLDYPNLRLHVADDGSIYNAYGTNWENPPCSWWGDPEKVSFSRQERRGLGASLNEGLRRAFEFSPLVAYFMDDWAVSAPYDLKPWADLLLKNESIGAVRLGCPHPDLTGRVHHFIGGWGLILDRHHFAFSYRPTLFHRRFFEAYGAFEEGVDAYNCEQKYSEAFNILPGPDILYALRDPWEHAGRAELAHIVPGGKA